MDIYTLLYFFPYFIWFQNPVYPVSVLVYLKYEKKMSPIDKIETMRQERVMDIPRRTQQPPAPGSFLECQDSLARWSPFPYSLLIKCFKSPKSGKEQFMRDKFLIHPTPYLGSLVFNRK